MTQIETSFRGITTANRTIEYYSNSPEYLTGPLGGTCHFGFTPEGNRFNLKEDLHSMEVLLGRKIGLSAGSTVLDAGCGYGRVAATMANEFGYRVLGVDLLAQRLNEARRYTTERGVAADVKPVNGTYCQLPLKDSSVSAVYTMETLVHADPLENALGEFRRVLEPGGRLVLFEYSVPDYNSLDPVRRAITDNMVNRTGMASIGKFTHGAFPDLLRNAGFEDISVEEISRNVYPTWRWLFWKAIRDSWPDILRLKFRDKTNLAGSLLIYPYRHFIGYNVVTATSPYIRT